MRFVILGSLHAVESGRTLALGGPRQRLVLALLVAGANRPVAVDQLVDGLWGDHAPGRPRKTLQVYVANLRRILGPGVALRTEPAGYRLAVADDEVDALEFEARLARARRPEITPAAALAELDAALGLWRGEPFGGVGPCDALTPATVRLQELRLAAEEDRAARRIEAGRAGDALGGIEALIGEHPLRERLWALAMHARYVLGRQADALATGRQLRTVLADELGIDPSPAVQDLERRILQQDPTLLPAAPVTTAPATGTVARAAEQVAALSCSLAGLDHLALTADVEDTRAVLDRLVPAVSAVIEHHGGEVTGTGDATVAACFGLRHSGEHDSVDAVRAALAVVATVAAEAPTGGPDHPLAAQVGVHTGLVVVAPGPAPVGEAPVVADRLRATARPGEVLVSSGTAALLAGHVPLDACRDRPDPVPGGSCAVRVLAAPAWPTAPPPAPPGAGIPPLLGRAGEIEDLAAAVADGHGPLVAVTGEGGIGKSRLATALTDRLAGDDGPAVVVVRCAPSGYGPALHPFAAALRYRYGSVAEIAPILAAMGGAGSVTGRALVDLAGWPPDDPDRPPVPADGGLSDADRAWAVQRWLDLLAGDRRLVLVVEDAHRADADTVALLADLADRHDPGIVVVVTARPPLPGPLLTRTGTTIALDPLDPASARRLVRELPGGRTLSMAAVNEIVARAGGVPLYLTELGRATIDRRARQTDGPDGPRHETVPPSLRATLVSRLDAVPSAKASALRCAVLGPEFDLDAARLATGAEPDVVAADLATLAEAGVLVPRGGMGDGYAYAHTLLHEAAYAALLRRDRVDLHRRLVDDPEFAARLSPGERARHLEGADRPADAVRAWCAAGGDAVLRARLAEGADAARRAQAGLDHVPPGPDRDRLELQACLILAVSLELNASGSDELRAVLDRAAALARTHRRLALIPDLDSLRIAGLQAVGAYHEAEALGVAALRLAAEEDIPDLAWAMGHFHGATLIWRGEIEAGLALLEPLLDHDRPEGRRPDGSRFRPGPLLAASACSRWALGALAAHVQERPDEAAARFRQAHAVLGATGSPLSRCLVESTEAIARQLVGDADGVFGLAEPALERAVELGNDWWFVWCQVLVGWSVAMTGDPAAGLAQMTEGLDHAGDVRQLRPWFLALTADVEARTGAVDAAVERVDEGLALAAATGEGFFVPAMRRVRAEVLGHQGAESELVAAELTGSEAVAVAQGQPLFARQAREARERLARP